MGYPGEPFDPPEVGAFQGDPGGDEPSPKALRKDVSHRFPPSGDGRDLIENRMKDSDNVCITARVTVTLLYHRPTSAFNTSVTTVSLAPGCDCMIHHKQDSERHEVFGVKEFKKQQ